MAIKKFISTFTIIIFCFLCVAGFALITYINDQEVKAIDNSNNPDNENVPTQTGETFATKYIDYPDAFNFILFVTDYDGFVTDVMMIVNYDPQNKKISTLSLPRDTVYKTIYDKDEDGNFKYTDGKKDIINIKINSIVPTEIDKAVIAGRERALAANETADNETYRKEGFVNAVNVFESFFNLNIKYYVKIDLSIFRDVIDELGGVEFNLPVDLDYDDPLQDLHIHFNAGMQHFDGKDSEKLLRFRHPNEGAEYSAALEKLYPGSDIARIDMQHIFLNELVKQKANFFYATKITSILNVVFDKVETNIDMEAIVDLIKYIPDFNMDEILWETLPGSIVVNDYIHDDKETREMILNYFKGSNN